MADTVSERQGARIYIKREVERTIDRMLMQGKVVLITSARQVGKTTMLKHHLESRYNYVTMEDPSALLQASQDALLFFRSNELPIVIDEVQKALQLFPSVKFLVNQSDE